MTKGRLEAFSDGVLAIIITIMVLEMKVPHASELQDLLPLYSVFLSYALSFIYIAIYWNNHHHLLHLAKQINGRVMWANMHLLFWLSLVPFATGWMDENHLEKWPVVVYGVILFMAAVAYLILQESIVKTQSEDRAHFKAIFGKDWKGKASLSAYASAILLALTGQLLIAGILYVVVALMWIVPDPRIEKRNL